MVTLNVKLCSTSTSPAGGMIFKPVALFLTTVNEVALNPSLNPDAPSDETTIVYAPVASTLNEYFPSLAVFSSPFTLTMSFSVTLSGEVIVNSTISPTLY